MKHKKYIRRPLKATFVDDGRLRIEWDNARKVNPAGLLRCADFILSNGHAADPELLEEYSELVDRQNLNRQ
jgi:hypothetical protein